MNRVRLLLLPISFLYWVVIKIRNWFFVTGILKSTKIDVPVISVGNISVGGVGKTPFVEMLAENLRKRRRKVAIVSRGYGRKSSGYVVVSNGAQRCAESWKSGDEPAQLAEKLAGAVIVVDERRVRAAQRVISEFDVNVILLDDGFQHRYVKRDLDLVVITANDILSGDFLLPAGNRREPISSLRRADIIAVSQCESKSHFDEAAAILRRFIAKPIIGAQTALRSLRRASSNEEHESGKLNGQSVVAFSGIGNPVAFQEMLNKQGVSIKSHLRYPDHHWYSNDDLDRIVRAWRETHSDSIITTEKDVARLREPHTESFLSEYPVYYIEIGHVIVAEEQTLEEELSKVLN